ncbi:MAG: VTT domain-containing protein [Bryobacteraceae bacterium]
MRHILEFLVHHGYAVVAVAVLAEQLGIPVPATPVLLAAGAVAGMGSLSLGACVLIAMLSAVLGDIIWFLLGKRYGTAILSLLCRISLEPDSCVNYTKRVYSKFGPSTLLFAKFVPGLSTVMTPLAGRFLVPFGRFLMFDSAGALLWTGTYICVGWLFRAQLEHLADALFQMGSWLGVVVFSLIALYALYRYARRRDLYRELRLARIAPWELKERIDLGESLLIFDLRNPIEWVEGIIPGATLISITELSEKSPETIENCEVVLYCS